MQSEYTATVVYPLVRPTPIGTAPLASSGVSPLLPTALPGPTPDELPEQVKPPVSFPCLLTDTLTMGEAKQSKLQASMGAWALQTQVAIRVLQEDVELGGGRTVFDGCQWVEIDGKRYEVLNMSKMATSMERSGTYYVFLRGATKN